MTHLTRTECNALRGFAILGIVLHNYAHWLSTAVKENEYTFSQANADGLWNAIMHPNDNLLLHLISFFGHYGVPVFLFLSAYGLTMKYEIGGAEDRLWAFIKKHFVKLFAMMITGYGLFLFFDHVIGTPRPYSITSVLSMLTLTGNFFPQPDRLIWPGPYWFFGLMMQLYIVYRLFLYKRHWALTVAFIVVCWVLQMFCDPVGDTLNRLHYNFIGGMLPFGMGLLYARGVQAWQVKTPSLLNHNGVLSGSKYLFCIVITVLLLIVLMSMNYQTWFFVPVFIIIGAVATVKMMPSWMLSPVAWIGVISSSLFVFHPITRKALIGVGRHGMAYEGLLVYLIASIVVAWTMHKILHGNSSK